MFRNAPPWVQALARAVYGGIVLAGVAYFTALGNGQSQAHAGIAAGAAFFGYLVVRGGIEGVIDTQASSAPTPPVVTR